MEPNRRRIGLGRKKQQQQQSKIIIIKKNKDPLGPLCNLKRNIHGRELNAQDLLLIFLYPMSV